MTTAQALEIAESFTRRTIGKSELLLQAGRVSDEYLFLESGLLRAFAHDAEGNEVTTCFYSGGQVAWKCRPFSTVRLRRSTCRP